MFLTCGFILEFPLHKYESQEDIRYVVTKWGFQVLQFQPRSTYLRLRIGVVNCFQNSRNYSNLSCKMSRELILPSLWKTVSLKTKQMYRELQQGFTFSLLWASLQEVYHEVALQKHLCFITCLILINASLLHVQELCQLLSWPISPTHAVL